MNTEIIAKIIYELRPLAIFYANQYAEDLLHDVFINMVTSPALPTDIDELRKLASRCVTNQFINSYRRLKAKKRNPNLSIPFATYAPSDAEDKIELKGAMTELMHSVSSLNTQALMLFVSGNKVKDIAAAMGIPMNTALGRIRYARKALSCRPQHINWMLRKKKPKVETPGSLLKLTV